MKKLRNSKTFWVNFVAIAAAALAGVLGADVLSPQMASYMVAGLGALNIILRVATGKPIKGV